MKKKKVLILNIGTEIGGIETSLINFLNYISNKDIEIDLLLWKKPGPLYTKIPKNVNIIDSVTPGSIRDIIKSLNVVKIIWYCICKIFARFGYDWKGFKRIKKEYDIAISYCQNGYSPYYLIDKVKANKKYLYYHHGSYEKTDLEKERDKNYYFKFTNIIAPSKSCKEMLSEEFQGLKDKIKIIPNLLDINEIHDKAMRFDYVLNSDEKKCHLLTVSRVSYEKGIDISILAAKILKENKFEFIWEFIGDGPEMENISKMIEEYNLQENCLMLGRKENPFPYIQNADLVVQSSRVEAHPIAILEALVLKRRVIASDILAIREVLTSYKSGYICELNPQKFAEAIISVSQETLECPVFDVKEHNINFEAENKIDRMFE